MRPRSVDLHQRSFQSCFINAHSNFLGSWTQLYNRRGFRKRAGNFRRLLVAASTNAKESEGNFKLFIFGFGYLALGLATQLSQKGWSVKGTCRSAEKQRDLRDKGYESYIFDTDCLSLGLGRNGMAALKDATHILVTISPAQPCETCPVIWMLGQNFKPVAESLQWIGYISSTSVYGDHEGDWVTEESDLRAETGSGLAKRSAEESWLAFGDATGLPVHSFRLAGIYGPGRSALNISKKGGKRSGKQFTSRCHVYDICQVLMASMDRPHPGGIYNVADDDPSSREAVLEYVSSHFKTFALPEDCSVAASGISSNGRIGAGSRSAKRAEKRVCNRKMKQDLGVSLLFPSYKEGLQAIHSGDSTPFP